MDPQGQMVQRKGTAWFSFRGAIGFGAGSVIALLGMFLPPSGLPWAAVFVPIGFAFSGAIGGASLALGRKRRNSMLRTAIGFGIGFLVLGFAIPLPLMYLERPFPGYESDLGMLFWWLCIFALVYGFGFYIAAVIGAAFISSDPILVLIGTGVFGIGGATTGILFVIVFLLLGPMWPVVKIVCFCIGIVVAYSIGGAYLGARVDSSDIDKVEPDV